MDEQDPIQIVLEHLKVLRVEPGDTLVMRLPGRIPMERYERIGAILKEHFGPDVKCLVLEDGADLGVVRCVPMTQEQLDDGVITGGEAARAALGNATGVEG